MIRMHGRYASLIVGIAVSLLCFVGSALATITVVGAAIESSRRP